jgi:hypothetical protein
MAERLLRLLFGGALILTIGTSLRRAVPVGRRLLQQSRSYPGVHICRAFRATTTSSVLSMTPVIAPGVQGTRIGDGADRDCQPRSPAGGCRNAGRYCPAWRDSRTRT